LLFFLTLFLSLVPFCFLFLSCSPNPVYDHSVTLCVMS
jgi:hypothetical protein